MAIDHERIRALLAKSKASKSETHVNVNSLDKLAALRAKFGMKAPVPVPVQDANSEVSTGTSAAANTTEIHEIRTQDFSHSIDKYGNAIDLNKEQLEVVTRVANGESVVLIGPAGSGKTTTSRATIQALIDSGRAGVIRNAEHKYLVDGTPGVVCVAYTRRAVANLQKAVSDDMRRNCITIHKFLEYQPVYDTVLDRETGDEKTIMRFQPFRNKFNPIPACVKVVIIEESSMVSVELFQEIVDACPHNPQFIFLGDIQQLPPVFGSAILGFKMLELPTIELIQIYRQALESPIIRLAHRILSGIPIPANEFTEWKIPGKLTLHPWKKKLDADLACLTAAKFFTAAIDSGAYNPDEDQILIPFNKSFGTDELNKHIAQHLAKKRGAIVYEIIAGFNKHYFSIGDKVLVEKEDAEIIGITPNPQYLGVKPAAPSTTLDYWGAEQGSQHHVDADEDYDVDAMLELAASSDPEDRVRQCSHTIKVRMADTEQELSISAAAEVNAMLLAYCLTVHKSQGSEWRKVFLVLHQSHATMIQRELLYTACTRAREELYVICEAESFVKGIVGQRIKGNTLKEKCEFFMGKVDAGYLNKYYSENPGLKPSR